MDFYPCSSCRCLAKPQQLAHCCIPSTLLCVSCQRKQSCRICSKPYADRKKCPLNCKCPLSNQKKPIRVITPLKMCLTCKKNLSSCKCKSEIKTRSGSVSKNQRMGSCGRCGKVTRVSDLFFNINCQHELGPCCFTSGTTKCFCGAKIHSNSAGVFNERCVVCDMQFKEGGNWSGTDEYFVCRDCKVKSEDLEKSMKLDNSSSTMNTSKPGSEEENKQKKEGLVEKQGSLLKQEEVQKEKVVHRDGDGQDTRGKNEKEKQQILDHLFSSPKTKDPKQNHSKDQSNKKEQDTARVRLQRTQVCSSCSLQFQYNLFQHSKCTSKTHKVCKICYIKVRNSKQTRCRECDIQHLINLNLKLHYQEIPPINKAQYITKNIPNFGFCTKCEIVIQSKHIYEGLCKICII